MVRNLLICYTKRPKDGSRIVSTDPRLRGIANLLCAEKGNYSQCKRLDCDTAQLWKQLGSVKAQLWNSTAAGCEAALGRGRCLAGHLDSAKASSVFQLQLGIRDSRSSGEEGKHLFLEPEGSRIV